jgi:putative transposase
MARTRHRVSERRACRVLGQDPTTQRYAKRVREDEGPLRALIIQLARDYAGYGVPRILDLLRRPGWHVNRTARRLNQRPRKMLDFRSPAEVLNESVALIG